MGGTAKSCQTGPRLAMKTYSLLISSTHARMHVHTHIHTHVTQSLFLVLAADELPIRVD